MPVFRIYGPPLRLVPQSRGGTESTRRPRGGSSKQPRPRRGSVYDSEARFDDFEDIESLDPGFLNDPGNRFQGESEQ